MRRRRLRLQTSGDGGGGGGGSAALGRAASLGLGAAGANARACPRLGNTLSEANIPRRKRTSHDVRSGPRATSNQVETLSSALPLGSELVSFSIGQSRANTRRESEGLLSLCSIGWYTSTLCQKCSRSGYGFRIYSRVTICITPSSSLGFRLTA